MSTDESSTINFNSVPEFHFGDLHYFDYDLGFAFSSLHLMVRSQESIILERKEILKKDIDADAYYKSISDDYTRASYYWNYFEPTENAIKDLENIFRAGSILIAFSVLESKMFTLCEMVESETKIPFLPSNKKSPFQSYVKYLKKDLRIKPIKSNKHATQIDRLRLLRNHLTHANNKISAADLASFFALPHITIDKLASNHVSITSPELALDLIKNIEQYFKELITEVDTRIKNIHDFNAV